MALRMLLGIGNELKGDDAIGNAIASRFSAPGWRSIPCGTVPENFISVVRKEKPHLIVIVDAAQMGLAAGSVRIIEKSMLSSDIPGTHGLPLCRLVSELQKASGAKGSKAEVVFIGIEPKVMDIGSRVKISGEVLAAAKTVEASLKDGSFSKIEKFRSTK